MDMRDVIFRLSEPMIASALRLAQARDATLGQIVRDALSAEIRRCSRNAKTPNRAEEQLLAPLRVLLASDFARAKSWPELKNSYRCKVTLCVRRGAVSRFIRTRKACECAKLLNLAMPMRR